MLGHDVDDDVVGPPRWPGSDAVSGANLTALSDMWVSSDENATVTHMLGTQGGIFINGPPSASRM